MGFKQAPALPYDKLGIVEDGNTASQAIEKDKYVIWKGQNYFAKTDILQGETFEVDTNLTAMPEGVVNGIVSALNASLTPSLIGTITNSSQGNQISINTAGKRILIFEVMPIWESAVTNAFGYIWLLISTIDNGKNVSIVSAVCSSAGLHRYACILNVTKNTVKVLYSVIDSSDMPCTVNIYAM